MEVPRAAASIAVVINLLELFNNFKDEFNYIWRTIREFKALKGVYIIARYYVFISHCLLFIYGDTLEYLPQSARSKQKVERYVLFKNVGIALMLWTVDIPLMKRAYLMSGSIRGSLYLCYAISFVKICVDITTLWIIYDQRMTGNYSNSRTPPITASIYISFEMVIQGFILWISSTGVTSSRRVRTPVITRLGQSGIEPTVVGTMFIITLVVFVFAQDISPCVYPAFMTVASWTSCRLILNMHRVYHKKKRPVFDYSSDSE